MEKVVRLAGSVQENIPLDRIVEDPFLPRKSYPEAALAELAESIQQGGLLHAVIVSRRPDGYFALVGGSRRVRAARAAGFTHIPATVGAFDDPADIIVMALAENVQREDLEPLEEANAYHLLIEDYAMTLKDIARRVGKSAGHVRDRLKLLDLAPEVQQLVVDEVLSPSTAAALALVPSGEEQKGIADEAVREGLSTEDVRVRMRETEARPVEKRRSGRRVTVQKYRLSIGRLQEYMQRSFDVVKSLSMTPEERGRITAAHLALEEVSRRIREQISTGGRVVIPKSGASGKSGNVRSAPNFGEEWPLGHLALFDDPSMSDDDIASRTGRTITAVESMRKTLRRRRK